MSSITTAVPSGLIGDWCVHTLNQGLFADQFEPGCANATKGTTDSDFETICCDGDIIDTTADLFRHSGDLYIDLANLVCCRIQGDQQGGLLPIQSNDGRSCTTGTPTPLASLAATNTGNAAIYPVTYTSASGEAPNIGDFLFTLTPYCLWANTKSVDGMTEVTVPAARISTLPVGWPDSDNPLILSAYPTPVGTADILSSTSSVDTTTRETTRATSRSILASSRDTSEAGPSSSSISTSTRATPSIAVTTSTSDASQSTTPQLYILTIIMLCASIAFCVYQTSIV